MVRILQITDNMDIGGIQSFIMNVYRNIDRTKFQFDFLIFRDHEQIYEKEIMELGGRIYKLPGRKEGLLKNKRAIKSFFDEHTEYEVVHYNTSVLSDVGALEEAYRRNIPVRIIHSHSTKAPKGGIHTLLHKFNKRRIHKLATDFFSCGDLATEWFYSRTAVIDKVVVINNGVDCAQYAFSELKRQTKREELNINKETFVIGQVGRFAEVKNQAFSIHVLAELVQRNESLNPVLMLVGDGPLLEDMIKLAKELEVNDRVYFMGNRQDVPELLQAMDVMIMPSLYEGFPVTAIESQAAGLPCYLSDTITKTVVIKENVHMLKLESGYGNWADMIIQDTRRRIIDNHKLVEAGFDIQTTIKSLEKYYN